MPTEQRCVRVSYHITGKVMQIIKGTLQCVGVHVQDDHVLQGPTAHPLKEENIPELAHFLCSIFIQHSSEHNS